VIVFLDADCVINGLIGIGFIKPGDPWKSRGVGPYSARFYHASTGGTLCFEVHIDNGLHKVSASYVRNLQRVYQQNLSAIINTCKIQALSAVL